MPFWPLAATKETVWPSFRLLKPSLWIALKWTNRSSPPLVGVMKPKPFSSLNHLTVPVSRFAMVCLLNRYEVRCQSAHSTYAVLLITTSQLSHNRPFLREVLGLTLIIHIFLC